MLSTLSETKIQYILVFLYNRERLLSETRDQYSDKQFLVKIYPQTNSFLYTLLPFSYNTKQALRLSYQTKKIGHFKRNQFAKSRSLVILSYRNLCIRQKKVFKANEKLKFLKFEAKIYF